MSSDDSGDSGFDKEAEREKLREKYEQDQKDRENTRRMSELLLQGATMTGKHCGECGDPIFRYDGQEFCPTCQREVEGGDAGQDEGQQQPPEGSDEQSAGRSTSTDGSATSAEGSATPDDGSTPAEATREQSGSDGTRDPAEADEGVAGDATGEDERSADGEPRVEINDVRVADRHADRSNLRQPPSQQDGTGQQSPGSNRRDQQAPGPHRHDHSHEPGHSGGRNRGAHGRPDRAHSGGRTHASDAGDLATARESLVRKLTDLARRAEETDDVARSRDLLAATREAAEALAALDQANR